MVGLLRFLDLLASFDWKNKPFVVNFNGELQSEFDFNKKNTSKIVQLISSSAVIYKREPT